MLKSGKLKRNKIDPKFKKEWFEYEYDVYILIKIYLFVN